MYESCPEIDPRITPCPRGQDLISLTCQGTGSAAELGVVLVTAVPRLHDQLAVGEVGIVHTRVLHLQVLHRDVHPVLGLLVPVAGPAGVVPTVRGLGPVYGESVVEENSHSRVPVQTSTILQPGDAGPQAAVDVARYADVGVEREPGLGERYPGRDLPDPGSPGGLGRRPVVVPARRSGRSVPHRPGRGGPPGGPP